MKHINQIQIRKIPDTSEPVKKLDYNANINKIESKIPNISDLAANVPLTAVDNKMPNISSLVKKTDYNTKKSEIEKKNTDQNHDKYINIPEFNRFTAAVFDAQLAQANVVTKTDFDTKLIGLNEKINSNKTEHLLVKDE